MSQQESNNDFFSYQGTISRKNYIINMLILLAIFVGVSFIRIENFAQFITYKFLYAVIVFMISMLKFVSIMAMLSVVYRRIMDFTQFRPVVFQETMKKVFVILFVCPVLYDFCLRFFIDIMPALQGILDFLTIFVLYPLAIIAAIIFCFLKRG